MCPAESLAPGASPTPLPCGGPTPTAKKYADLAGGIDPEQPDTPEQLDIAPPIGKAFERPLD